jgi:hypothetical protein
MLYARNLEDKSEPREIAKRSIYVMCIYKGRFLKSIPQLLICSVCGLLVAVLMMSGCSTENMKDTKDKEVEHMKLQLIEKEKYKECFVFHEQYNMFWPQRDVRIEMNHALRIEWSNFEEYREFFENPNNVLMISFMVERREVYKIATQNRWNTIVHCKILGIEMR